MPVVIEVVARLGDTTLDHDHIPPGSTYHLGTTALVAKPGTHRVGLVEITMERTFRVETPVSRPRLTWRPLIYVLGSFALHMTIWTIAMLATPIEQMEVAPIDLRPRFVVHIEDRTPPPPKPQHDIQARQPTESGAAAVAKQKMPEHGATPTAADMGDAAAKAIARVARSVPDVNKAMEGTGPLYSEDDATAKGFGGHLWDINSDPDYATIKTGPGYNLYEAAYSGEWDLGMTKQEKALSKIKAQTALAHRAAIRGDCVPSHRIAKWLHKLDEAAFKEIYMGDPEIVWCLGQPVPPVFVKADAQEGLKSAIKPR
ncbi:MAG TPA: hypothetical protein VMZ53_34555 [Kofleriaceae bacterium]|nr:hypothetical protein [Kofleriaceae bacterium]